MSSDKRAWISLGVAPAALYLAHALGGANQLVVGQWLTMLLAVLLLTTLSSSRSRRALGRTKTVRPVAALFIATLSVAAWSLTPYIPTGPHPLWASIGLTNGSATINPTATILEMIKLGGLACIFIIGCVQGASRRSARTTVDVVLALGVVYAAVSLLLFWSGFQVKAGRLTGGFLSANSGATVFGVLTVVGLGSLSRQWKRSGAGASLKQLVAVWFPLSCVLLFVTCLLLTASRMGLAATVLASAMFLIWETSLRGLKRLPTLLGTLAVALGIGMVVSGGAAVLWGRIDELDSDTANRAAIFLAHWHAFLSSPVFGYGLGSFVDINSLTMTNENYAALWSIRAAHNVYLQWLEEAGVAGAAPMFLLIGVVIVSSAKRAASTRSGGEVARGLVASSSVILIHGLTDYALQVPSVAAFWAFLLGLQFAYGRARKRRKRGRDARKSTSFSAL